MAGTCHAGAQCSTALKPSWSHAGGADGIHVLQFLFGAGSANSGRRSLYAAVLSRLRQLMISRMAKPEEVGSSSQCLLYHGLVLRCTCTPISSWALHGRQTDSATRVTSRNHPRLMSGSLSASQPGAGMPEPCISLASHAACTRPCALQVIVVEDENGNIVRETMKDTDVLARYKTMHEILVYLTHLDHKDTENQMLASLRCQVLPRPACPMSHSCASSLPACRWSRRTAHKRAAVGPGAWA